MKAIPLTLDFRLRPLQFQDLDLGTLVHDGSVLPCMIYIRESEHITGVTKIFNTGDPGFAYEGCAMTYYYFHMEPDSKSNDKAEYVVSQWVSLGLQGFENNLLKGDNLQRMMHKYPYLTKAMMNTFLLRSGELEKVKEHFFLTTLPGSTTDYCLMVPFDRSLSFFDDIQHCNIDIRQASPATQLLLRISMEIDHEVETNPAEFHYDLMTL